VPELSRPTLAEGESVADLLAEEIDLAEVGERGYHFEKLDQLALEHLFGVR
jgi:xylose isomerase